MRWFIIFLCFIMGLIGVLNLSGQSRSYSNTDYFRTLNRTASLGTLDSVFFNPSGTTRLADGMYLYLGTTVPFSFGNAAHPGLVAPSFAFVHKVMKNSIFVTVAPLPSSRVVLTESATIKENIIANYNINDVTYEASIGGGFLVSDSLMLSLSGKILGSFDTHKIQYYLAKDTLSESYFLNRFELGLRLHLGLSYQLFKWVSMSFNLDTPGFGFSKYGMVQFVISKASEASQSSFEERPQKRGFSNEIFVLFPLRFDTGISFFTDNIMTLQLTGYIELFSTKNRLPDSKESLWNVVKPVSSYGGGVGVDLEVSRVVTLGFGTYYDNRESRNHFYKSIADTISEKKLTSLNFSTGILVKVQPKFNFTLSLAYPLYLSFSKGLEVYKFNDPYTGGRVEVGGIIFGIGFNWNFLGL